MSDADWWLCHACHSLNSLSARRCYSCRARRPKRPTLASELLGYRALVDADGRVRIQPLPSTGRPVEPLRRLRDPPRRSILAIAAPPPHGARITYWMGDPERDVRPPGSAGAPRERRRSFVLAVDPLTPPRPPRQMVAVPIEPDAVPEPPWTWPPAADRQYWQGLFDDLPLPHASRLSRAAAPPPAGMSHRAAGSLSSRGLLARISRKRPATALRPSEPATPWPVADLAVKRPD